MKVVATDDIAMGQEIFTSYLEPFHTNLQRRAILLRGKSFECSCARHSIYIGTVSSYLLLLSLCPKLNMIEEK